MESIISREALSGSLESLQNGPWPTGVGVKKSISKIKLSRFALQKRKVQSPANSRTASRRLSKDTQDAFKVLFAVVKTPRIIGHSIVYALVIAVLTLASGNSAKLAKAKMTTRNSGYGSVLEPSAAASVAAQVASQTNLVVASEATTTATTLSSQVSLPTVGDDTLAKRQVVATAGAATHTTMSYRVDNGETITAIASKFNITTDTIKWANDLDNIDTIKPGQVLTILPISGLSYMVKDGDSAESIAQAFGSNAAQIVSFNNAEIKGLATGQKIIVPDGTKAEQPKPVVKQAKTVATINSFVPTITRYNAGGNGYAYGYCTYYVASRRSLPSFWGNANGWYYNAQASGFTVGNKPVAGAVAWTPAGYYGHVAYVEQVSGNQVLISEMNYNGNWNRVTTRWVPSYSFRYIY